MGSRPWVSATHALGRPEAETVGIACHIPVGPYQQDVNRYPLLAILAVLAPGCMTSHQGDATPVASMAAAETFKGYTPGPNETVRLYCRPPGADSEHLVATTSTPATGRTWAGGQAFPWAFTEVIPGQCWTPVAPGASGANVWAVVGQLDAYRIDDVDCAFGLLSWFDVPECSSKVPWTRLVAPNGTNPGANPLAGAAPLEVVASGLSFAEGPMWEPENDRLLFTDIEADTVYAVTPGGNPIALPVGAGAHTNGQAKWIGGPVIRCEHANQRVIRQNASGGISVIADTYAGQPFNAPNDAVVSLDGTVYFTDPTYGENPVWGGATPTLGFRGVYRVEPGEPPVLEASWPSRQPNGIAFSPDYTTLYVADTQGGEVLAFAVAADGSLGPEQHLAWVDQPDGMAVDVDGNLFVTGSAGVTALAPNGAAWGTIGLAEATNCTFGGEDRTTLFITTRSTVYSVELDIAGTPPMF